MISKFLSSFNDLCLLIFLSYRFRHKTFELIIYITSCVLRTDQGKIAKTLKINVWADTIKQMNLSWSGIRDNITNKRTLASCVIS